MSPGMRAARALFPHNTAISDGSYSPEQQQHADDWLQGRAAIIERETGVAELVEALKLADAYKLPFPAGDAIRAALTKATGGAS